MKQQFPSFHLENKVQFEPSGIAFRAHCEGSINRECFGEWVFRY